MLFHLKRPSPEFLERLLAAQESAPLTHRASNRYVKDHRRTHLGEGDACFERAKQAALSWSMLRLSWVEPIGVDRPVESGNVVGILARFMGVWTINACRVTEVRDEPDHFSIEYATLPAHIECGVERFAIEREKDGGIYYDLSASSKPGHILTRAFYPVCRLAQRQFRIDSSLAMYEAARG